METIVTLARIAAFKAKPEDLPFNQAVAVFMIAAAIVTSVLQNSLSQTAQLPYTLFVVQTVVYAMGLFFLLRVNQKTNRFVQTTIAFFGIISLEQLVSVTLMTTVNAFAIATAFKFWRFIVLAYVIRHSLEIKTGQSFLLLIGLMLFNALVVTLFFSEQIMQVIQASQTVTQS